MRGFLSKLIAYLQQEALVQVVLAQFCPFGQLVQVACFAFAFLTGTLPFAITEVTVNAIASILNIIFFIFIFFKLNNIRLSDLGFRRLFNRLSVVSSQLYDKQIDHQIYKEELAS